MCACVHPVGPLQWPAVQIAGRKNLRFYSPEGGLDMSIFTEYISVEVYNQTPKNKLEKYLISGGTGGKVPPPISSCSKRKVKS